MSVPAGGRYEWDVVQVHAEQLKVRLNQLEPEWEVFSIVPTIQFGSKLMGAPVPNAVLCNIVVRRPKP